jgi:hypothetical protein
MSTKELTAKERSDAFLEKLRVGLDERHEERATADAKAMEARVRDLTKEYIRKRRQTNDHARY